MAGMQITQEQLSALADFRYNAAQTSARQTGVRVASIDLGFYNQIQLLRREQNSNKDF
jgi:hypothetical protein